MTEPPGWEKMGGLGGGSGAAFFEDGADLVHLLGGELIDLGVA